VKILSTHNLDDQYWVQVYNSQVLVADCINNTIIMHNKVKWCQNELETTVTVYYRLSRGTKAPRGIMRRPEKKTGRSSCAGRWKHYDNSHHEPDWHSIKSWKGEESSGSDKKADEKSPVPVFDDARTSLAVVWRYVCSYKTKNASLSRLEIIWTESCSSYITAKNKAHIIPQLFWKATMHVYMHAAPQNLHFTLKCMIVLKWSHIM